MRATVLQELTAITIVVAAIMISASMQYLEVLNIPIIKYIFGKRYKVTKTSLYLRAFFHNEYMSKNESGVCRSFWNRIRNFDYEYFLDFGYITTEPHRQLLLGYLWYIILGVGCLSLPFCTTSHVKFIDNLFTSVSAVSTTGLATVDVSSAYSFWGQLIVLLLIQLGGIGYMTMSSYVMFLLTKHFTEIKKGVLDAEFATPGGLQMHSLVKSIIYFTFFFEAAGAVALYYFFAKQGINQPIWAAIFHSVSAFCTAGFSTFPDNLVQFSTNWGVNIVIIILSYAGAMGFIVMTDIWKKITVRGYRVTFTTKNICLVTVLLTIWGTVHLFCIEPSLRMYDAPDRFLISLFQTVSAADKGGSVNFRDAESASNRKTPKVRAESAPKRIW